MDERMKPYVEFLKRAVSGLPIFIYVEMFQGIIEEVKPFISLEDAEAELRALKREHDIAGDDFEGTDIEGSTIYSTALK